MKLEILRVNKTGTIRLKATDELCGTQAEFVTGLMTSEHEVLTRLLERAAHELGRQRIQQLMGQLASIAVLALLWVVGSEPVQAQQTSTLNWIAPTQRVDGSPIPPGALTYRVYGARQGTPRSVPLTSALTAQSWVHSLTGAFGQTWCYHVTAFEGGLESAPSGEACKTFAPAPPSPPQPPTLTVVGVGRRADWSPVFRISATTGARGSSVLGMAQVGTPCSGPLAFRYRNHNWYRVDPAAVDWWGSPELAALVAAPCRAS